MQQYIYLRTSVGFDAVAHYGYSLEGNNFITTPYVYQLQPANFRGSMIGLFTYNEIVDAGYADIDYFHYDCKK